MSFPGAGESSPRFAFFVENKGKAKEFAWVWNERVEPKQPRVPNPEVLAVRVKNEEEKQFLIGAVPDVFFTEPHYNGFPAILVRLGAIGMDQLRELLLDAWRIQAPKAIAAAFEPAV